MPKLLQSTFDLVVTWIAFALLQRLPRNVVDRMCLLRTLFHFDARGERLLFAVGLGWELGLALTPKILYDPSVSPSRPVR